MLYLFIHYEFYMIRLRRCQIGIRCDDTQCFAFGMTQCTENGLVGPPDPNLFTITLKMFSTLFPSQLSGYDQLR